ncbi:MAG: hypothetical protein ACMUEL_02935 [Flavobacteriales bacterium Tduv]
MSNRTHFWKYKALVWTGKARYKRLPRVHAQHLMEVMGIICIVLLRSLCTIYENKYN